MNQKTVGLGVLAIAIVVGLVWMQRIGKDEGVEANSGNAAPAVSSDVSHSTDPIPSSKAVLSNDSTKKKSVRHPFPEVPRTREGLSFKDDPSFAESKAEQQWLDRHGYPNEKQWEAYMLAPDALLKQAAEAGDMAAQAMLDARLLPVDKQAQQRLIEAGAEGNLFALSMLASYQGGSSGGDPVAAYALSRVTEMRGDTRAGITRDLMITKPLSNEQRMLGEAEALRLNEAIEKIYIAKHGVAPSLDKRPIGVK
ncbi:hypothetical protein [Xanthomonas translucens]|uniref:hypothetical protein n=1 Tax=Xanthomonas campestris pv. translucens TaxID=343 RepID=UPI000B163B61|nr:hypothetical protein [Xanthomonas translucens]